MKILVKALLYIGLICIGLGVISAGVSMLTGGGAESVMNHQIVEPYIQMAQAQINSLMSALNSFASAIMVF